MDLTAYIEYLTLKEAAIDYYEGYTDKWVFTERVSLEDILPEEIITIRKNFGDQAALHDYGLHRAHKTARFYRGALLEFQENTKPSLQ